MYTARLSKDGAFYEKDGTPCTQEEFETALLALANERDAPPPSPPEAKP